MKSCKIYVKVCEYCGTEFIAKRKDKRYCCRTCKDIAIKLRNGERVNANPKAIQKICAVCGKTFETRRDADICCSPECSKEHKRERNRIYDRTRRHRVSWDEYTIKRKQEAEDRAILKAEEKRKYRETHTVTRKCVVCGASFNCLDTETNKTCSHDCSIEYRRSLQRRYKDKRIPKEQRVDRIPLDLLFKRDKGKCWICGGDCDWNDWRISKNGYQYPGDNYPTKDHVVPIARGGLDSWDNVRLAHWLCNLKKSDNLVNAVPIDFDFAYSYKRKGQRPKRTAQYSLDGELIKIWDSTGQIERELGLKSKHIQNVCRGENSNTGNAYGYHWEYIEEA